MTRPKIVVNGFPVSNRTQRRYIAVVTRAEPFTVADAYGRGPHTYVAYAEIAKRSDNLDGLRRIQRSYGRTATGSYMVLIDTTTGEEIR